MQTSVILAGTKRDSRRHSTTNFWRSCSEGNNCKLSNIRRFIILSSGEGLTFTKNNCVNFSNEKRVFRVVYFLRIREKKLCLLPYFLAEKPRNTFIIQEGVW